jgi:hypothetical protein
MELRYVRQSSRLADATPLLAGLVKWIMSGRIGGELVIIGAELAGFPSRSSLELSFGLPLKRCVTAISGAKAGIVAVSKRDFDKI